MDNELARLEDKVEQMLVYCRTLLAENDSLRSRVAELENDRSRLSDKIGAASQRLDDLMAQLPE